MARNVVTNRANHPFLAMKKQILTAAMLSLPFPLSAQLVINEVLYDPAFDGGDPSVGDANGDGTRDASEDEFIELVNVSGGPLDLTGWTISDNQGVRHIFAGGVLADGQAVVVFGGGSPAGSFGGSLVVTASETGWGLGNGGDSVSVSDPSSALVSFLGYGSSGDVSVNDESLVLATELDAASGYISHSSAPGAGGATYSPGTRVGGAPFGAGAILTVEISPDIFPENAGAAAAIGTVTRSGDSSSPLVVSLSSDNPGEATVPATVTIPAGQASVTFSVDAVDDAEPDGNQTVTISASGADLFSGTAQITVADNEAPIPTISLSADPTTISENGDTTTVTIEVSAANPSGYTFNLSSDDTSELTVPATVTIAPDSTTATFTATAVDDAVSDGTQSTIIIATDPNFTIQEASVTVLVSDDEGFAAPNVVINEVRIDDVGADDDEYIELYSPTGGPVGLDRLSVVVIGDSASGSGVVERVIDLTGQTLDSNYFLIGSDIMTLGTPDLVRPQNFLENSDNVSILLVLDFTGTEGDDLDVGDDGILETKPWAALLSGVALIEESNGDDGAGNPVQPSGTEWDYSVDLGIPGIGPDGNFVPGHVYRSPDGNGDWQIGPFVASEGDPNADPPVPGVEVADTPGSENVEGGVTPVDSLRILSFSLNLTEGSGVINATGLGTKVWTVETSADLGATDPWAEVAGGVSEQDQADGSTNFLFFFVPGNGETERFYRLVEVP